MKTITNYMREHLDSDVTSLCTCWKIIRQDQVVLCYTDSDEDLVIDGDTYLSIGAYIRTAIENTASLSVDNLEVKGMASDLVLPAEELRAGAFDHAEVYVFMASWMNPTFGMVKLRKGFFGEVQVYPNGTFQVELRGMMQKLAHDYMDLYSPGCRHDLGDSGCKVDLTAPTLNRGTQIVMPLQDRQFELLGAGKRGDKIGWYDPTNSGAVLTTAAVTQSGIYAARGDTDGCLCQDIYLDQTAPEFRQHIFENVTSFKFWGWRRDLSSEGNLSIAFHDDWGRNARLPGHIERTDGALGFDSDLALAGDATVEFWARFDADPASGERIFYGSEPRTLDNGDDVTDTYMLRFYAGEDQVMKLQFVEKRSTTSSSSVNVVLETPVLPSADRAWHHIALVREGAELRLYVDGHEVASGTESADFAGRAWMLRYFGRTANADYLLFACDELRVWEEARAQWQIAKERFHDLEGTESSLLYYFPFEEDLTNYGSGTLPFTPTLGAEDVSFENARSPVAAAYRGTDLTVSTGFTDVGNAWVLVALEGTIPPTANTMRITFEGQGIDPSGALLDSVFGYFLDEAAFETVPALGDTTTPWTRAGMVTLGGSNRVFRATITEDRAEDGWFAGGLVHFFTGANAGASMEVKKWTQETGEVELFLSLPAPIEEGDLFTIYPGCDKSRICCAVFFDNIENMFAAPDVPGEDELYRYPDMH